MSKGALATICEKGTTEKWEMLGACEKGATLRRSEATGKGRSLKSREVILQSAKKVRP